MDNSEFFLSGAKRLTMKQITDKSIYLWVLKWLLADLLRKTADAIDQGTCMHTNAQASMIIDELMNRPMSKEQASIYLGMGRSSFDKAVREGVRTASLGD